MGDEIAAMAAIDKAITELEDDEAARVLRWAVDKFGGAAAVVAQSIHRPSGAASLRGAAASHGADGNTPATYERISDLMDAAGPTSIAQHVLVGSYWFQVVNGREEFNGQEVNAELKDLGHGSSNITADYTSLIKQRYARQVQKTGKSRQARKRYRLTTEGIRRVEAMLEKAAE